MMCLLSLDLACDPTRTADVAAVIMQEGQGSMLHYQYASSVSLCYYILGILMHIMP